MVVPVTWTYGAAFYVYEDGALSWLGIPGEPNRFAAAKDPRTPVRSHQHWESRVSRNNHSERGGALKLVGLCDFSNDRVVHPK